MLRIAVCDDEPIFQKKLAASIKKKLQQFRTDCDIVCFSSGEELIEVSRQNANYDILFLDVNMKELDGIEAAKFIRMYLPDVYIIFVTAFITYALEGYKVNAERYLLKNEENFEDSLNECLNTILKKMNYKELRVSFDFQSGKVELPVDRILYIESQLHKIIFYVFENGIKEYYMYEKMDNIQSKLNGKGFYRIHQSFLVNMKHVENIERYEATLSEGSKINISKKYYKAVEDEFVRLKGEI